MQKDSARKTETEKAKRLENVIDTSANDSQVGIDLLQGVIDDLEGEPGKAQTTKA